MNFDKLTIFGDNLLGSFRGQRMLLLFAVGSLGFWLLLLGFTVAMIAAIEFERGKLATLSLVLTVLAVHFLGGRELLGYVREHYLFVIPILVAYLVSGTAWGVAKWYLNVHNARRRYDKNRERFMAEKRAKNVVMTSQLKEEWEESRLSNPCAKGSFTDLLYDRYDGDSCGCKGKPMAKNHKATILMWMTYWPWSLLWTVINDPVRKLFREIYYRISGRLQAISDKIFAGTENDFLTDDEKEEREAHNRKLGL